MRDRGTTINKRRLPRFFRFVSYIDKDCMPKDTRQLVYTKQHIELLDYWLFKLELLELLDYWLFELELPEADWLELF
jgi:hypothetical protein